MWSIVNHTPYAAEGGWVQDREANKIWLVAVKATYDLPAGGGTRLAREQRPVLHISEPRGDEGKSSLHYESDLLGVKPGTDVLVNGSAWAPRGRCAFSIDVKLRVGPIRKQLRVFGDRSWRRNYVGRPTISDPEPYECMPITFERAYGGWDRSGSDPAEHRLEARNPVGIGFYTSAAHAIGNALPNVEDPKHLITAWNDRPIPAGLSCVSWDWSPRRELAGHYDEQWLARRAPLWALDFDPRYHQCAPVDQQLAGHLHGREIVELQNLSVDGPIAFALPSIPLTFESRFGRYTTEHGAQLATVMIEPDLRRLTMTWQTSLVCNHRVDELDVTIVSMRPTR
jgi:hypothetical protein